MDSIHVGASTLAQKQFLWSHQAQISANIRSITTSPIAVCASLSRSEQAADQRPGTKANQARTRFQWNVGPDHISASEAKSPKRNPGPPPPNKSNVNIKQKSHHGLQIQSLQSRIFVAQNPPKSSKIPIAVVSH